MIAQMQADYEALVAELDGLTAAISATENDAAAARAELDGLMDGASVLAAMAEERAAHNRLNVLRRRLNETQAERKRLGVALERARLTAIGGVVDETRHTMGAALVEVYRQAIEARDQVYQAQREVGVRPVDSPFDAVCSALEDALRKVGAVVTPDSSRSVTVQFGDFRHVRRPIGWVAPVATSRTWRKVDEDDLATLARRMTDFNRRNRDIDD